MDIVSARNLALWLSWPSVLGEFAPAPLAGDSASCLPAAPWPEGDPRVTDVRQAFRESVRSCMAGHETVAVSFSGGLDSFAVLIEAARIAAQDGRRVVIAVADLTDDAGGSNVPIARRLVAAAGLDDLELYVSSTGDMPRQRPEWRPDAPALDALPLANRYLAEQAADRGATVMLGGNGADEILGAVRYLTGAHLKTAQWTACRSYWADASGARREAFVSEALALACRALPRRHRAFVYLALEWPELCTRAEAPDVIAEPLRGHVDQWSATWITELLAYHAAHHRTWAQAAAWDAVFPLTLLAGPGPIALKHPFQTPEFIGAVQQLPIARRYDPSLPHAYWRQKAQVIALIPDHARSVLPTAKQTFRAALTNQATEKSSARYLIEHDIISPSAWRSEQDPLLVRRVNALETWAHGALERGYAIAEDTAALTA